MCISEVLDGGDAASSRVATWIVCVCLVDGSRSAIVVREGRVFVRAELAVPLTLGWRCCSWALGLGGSVHQVGRGRGIVGESLRAGCEFHRCYPLPYLAQSAKYLGTGSDL